MSDGRCRVRITASQHAHSNSIDRMPCWFNALLCLPDGPQLGYIVADDTGCIVQIELGSSACPCAHTDGIDCQGQLLAPGFLDLQFNGALGVDFSTPSITDDDIMRVLEWLPSVGVTACCPTLISSGAETYSTIIPRLRALHAADSNHTAPHSRPRARILGVHFEGPFFNTTKKGAHAEHHLTSPGASGLASLMDRYALTDADIASGFLCIVSLAPELEGALESISAMSARGAIASIGHTAATYDQANAAVNAGARLVTHLFNAMPPLHHRNPGVVGLLGRPRVHSAENVASFEPLDGPPFFSMIADGVHLHPAVLATATRSSPDRTILVTDAMCACGLPAGVYAFGEMSVSVFESSSAYTDKHAVITGTQTLAGAVASLDFCVRTLAAALGPADSGTQRAINAVTYNPSRLLRCSNRLGTLSVGARADLLLMDHTLHVKSGWIDGQRCAF